MVEEQIVNFIVYTVERENNKHLVICYIPHVYMY